MKYFVIFSILTAFLATPFHAQENEADFFDYWESHSDIENSLFKHYSSLAYSKLDQRKKELHALKSDKDWIQRQSVVKSKLQEIVGPFPKKTPLNAQITGVLHKDGYRIEKVLYESLPKYYVSGALYIPDGVTENAPSIFYACGHSLNGFRATTYQHIIVNLVKKGFVVFTIDPMGQGERYEYWNDQINASVLGYADHEHSFAGAQCLISGYSTGNYFIWDVIRGIDFMLSRKEVDHKRLGMTGRSGGGNLTAYLGAVDDRIFATAPECYITSYEYLYKSIGPQCAEQNLYQLVSNGLDHGDFIEVRAPKPTLIISTTRDFFSIQGTRDTFKEAQRTYAALGASDNLQMVEDDDRHTSTKKNREAMYAFFQKELNNPGSAADLEVEIPTPEELQVSKTGQLVSSFNGKTIHQLNKDKVTQQVEALNISRKNIEAHIKNVVLKAKQISGYHTPLDYGKTIFSGRYVHPGRVMEKYLLTGSGDYQIPAIVLKPTNKHKNEIILYLDSEGMETALHEDSPVFDLVNQGYSVLLADLPGIGSLGPGYLKGDSYIGGISYNQWFGAMLVGKAFTGLRTEDLMRLLNFAERSLGAKTGVSAIAKGPLGGELLHAAAFNKNIKKVALIAPFLSYADIASTHLYNPAYIPFTVPGALNAYDLPDLMATLHPRNILIIDPMGGDGNPSDISKTKDLLEFPLKTYQKKGYEKNISFYPDHVAPNNPNILKQLFVWLNQHN